MFSKKQCNVNVCFHERLIIGHSCWMSKCTVTRENAFPESTRANLPFLYLFGSFSSRKENELVSSFAV